MYVVPEFLYISMFTYMYMYIGVHIYIHAFGQVTESINVCF